MVQGHILGNNGAIMDTPYNGKDIPIVGNGPNPNKYKPHQGKKEIARRLRNH